MVDLCLMLPSRARRGPLRWTQAQPFQRAQKDGVEAQSLTHPRSSGRLRPAARPSNPTGANVVRFRGQVEA